MNFPPRGPPAVDDSMNQGKWNKALSEAVVIKSSHRHHHHSIYLDLQRSDHIWHPVAATFSRQVHIRHFKSNLITGLGFRVQKAIKGPGSRLQMLHQLFSCLGRLRLQFFNFLLRRSRSRCSVHLCTDMRRCAANAGGSHAKVNKQSVC